ncbi:MAG: hypothetical protein QOE54_6039 [Streptosporangiaceae bacterium]|nr:hypothetical protein [Streptosporangiaceae bacterium]MDX6433673.1 hypothetical protein [Streptosporangiaceae bacterium]
MQSLPIHRSILAVDIEKSTSPLRTNPVKEELRRQVYRLLDMAMTNAGIEDRHLDPFEDRGDGVLALIHPVDEIPKTLLLNPFVPVLARLLLDYNAELPPGEEGRLGLRLRVVVHAGEVHYDGRGYFGEELDVACRLLDAPRVKKSLRETTAPLVLVVSEDIYWAIVRHDYDGIRGETFLPLVRLHVSGRRRLGYVHTPHQAPYEVPREGPREVRYELPRELPQIAAIGAPATTFARRLGAGPSAA